MIFCEGVFSFLSRVAHCDSMFPNHMHTCYECVARSHPLGFLTVEMSTYLCALQINALKYNFEQEFLSYLTKPEDAMQIATVR